MTNIAIELKELCALVQWDMVAAVAGDETVTVRPDGSVVFEHTAPDGELHHLLVGQLTADQYAEVALP